MRSFTVSAGEFGNREARTRQSSVTFPRSSASALSRRHQCRTGCVSIAPKGTPPFGEHPARRAQFRAAPSDAQPIVTSRAQWPERDGR